MRCIGCFLRSIRTFNVQSPFEVECPPQKKISEQKLSHIIPTYIAARASPEKRPTVYFILQAWSQIREGISFSSADVGQTPSPPPATLSSTGSASGARRPSLIRLALAGGGGTKEQQRDVVGPKSVFYLPLGMISIFVPPFIFRRGSYALGCNSTCFFPVLCPMRKRINF